LYVSTVSSPQAASSQAMMAPLCICSAEHVHLWDTFPSTVAARALALLWPLISTRTSLESVTVPIPTDNALAGTFSGSFPKKRLFTILVSVVRIQTPVLEARDVNGSLNARWPSTPMPPMKRSIPP